MSHDQDPSDESSTKTKVCLLSHGATTPRLRDCSLHASPLVLMHDPFDQSVYRVRTYEAFRNVFMEVRFLSRVSTRTYVAQTKE